jgi:peptide-methionine (R)-S-oxide reductase
MALFAIVFFANCSHSQQNQNTSQMIELNKGDKPVIGKVEKSDEEWKKILSPEQFYVLRQKGTERAFTGKFYKHKEKGVYVCGGCKYELFTSDQKYDSGCGWPSFYDELEAGRIKTKLDTSHGMVRTEILCGRCDGHLGHVFEDGPNPTGLRYCVNSLSLDFVKDEKASPKKQ